MDTKRKRIEALELFRSGYNCSQSVFTAFAPEIGMSRDMALTVSAGLGGGVGRMREVCGAMTALAMLAGFCRPMEDGKDSSAKRDIYALVQQMGEEFRQRNGSIVCRELLGLQRPEGIPQPDARTDAYYKKRPCAEIVGDAAEIACRILFENRGTLSNGNFGA